MEILDEPINEPRISRWQWWLNRQGKYNIGLLLSGTVAMILYCIIAAMIVDGFEITIYAFSFTIGFSLMILILANLFYLLGPLADYFFNPSHNELFRKRLFKFGYWFSIGLPFLAPALLVIGYFLRS